jgi:hypothetical protein
MKHYTSTGSVSETIGYSPPNISQNMFNSNHMYMLWFTHELTEGIHCITDVRSGMYKIQQGPNDLSI